MNKRELEKSIHVNLAGETSYGDYLQLEQILTAQHLKSRPANHDEMMFIIQHQTSELWMKLLIHELEAVIRHVRADALEPSFKGLARVAQIQRTLFDQWAILETLTPTEYLAFRDDLGKSSGFQSYQYRAIEFLLGNKDANALEPHRHKPEVFDWLSGLLRRPSLYDEFLMHLRRRGHAVPAECMERDWSLPYQANPKLMDVFGAVYANPDKHWDAYEMCEKLVDVEERFQLWRFRHMMTVKRVIGYKQGTGGSSGVGFLKQALDLTFFPELWDVRTHLRPAK